MISLMKDILFLLVIFGTNTINTITGFAGTLLAMPASILLIGIDEAKTILNIITLMTGVIMAFQNRQWINRKEFIRIIIFMFTSMILGIKLYEILPLKLMLTGYGVLILCISLKGLFIKKKFKVYNLFMSLILIAAGIIHGIFLSGGSLLVVYASSKFNDKKEFRATLAPVWIILSSFMLVDHMNKGFITKNMIILFVISIIPVIFGTVWGNYLHDKIDQSLFMKFTYSLLGISGLLILF
ncbi:sulfite exporter TauE/SafE family protein [uncultured Ilyobacter sp.]|uniref:sulfite exporter TauE/SafE family protein n=2 Tax=uncultured Ilyobacter sp. TaxID=544433 RepID=UPI002AA67DBB|nr:sulfite exporter TauE/SafE family protein [uncultured Ilyobacter sp.]